MASNNFISRGGRRKAFQAAFAEQAQKLASLGATDAEMAEFFGVDAQTLGRWRRRYPAFREAIEVGRAAARAGVVVAHIRQLLAETIGRRRPGSTPKVPAMLHSGQDRRQVPGRLVQGRAARQRPERVMQDRVAQLQPECVRQPQRQSGTAKFSVLNSNRMEPLQLSRSFPWNDRCSQYRNPRRNRATGRQHFQGLRDSAGIIPKIVGS